MNLTQVPISMIDTAVGDAGKVLTSNGSTLSWTASTASAAITKAWVSFNGATGTIFSSYNVSSITKNGTGDYTLNFTTPMADTNYSVAGLCGGSTNPVYASGSIPYVAGPHAAPTTSQFRIGTGFPAVGGTAGSRVDVSYTYIQVSGN